MPPMASAFASVPHGIAGIAFVLLPLGETNVVRAPSREPQRDLVSERLGAGMEHLRAEIRLMASQDEP